MVDRRPGAADEEGVSGYDPLFDGGEVAPRRRSRSWIGRRPKGRRLSDATQPIESPSTETNDDAGLWGLDAPAPRVTAEDRWDPSKFTMEHRFDEAEAAEPGPVRPDDAALWGDWNPDGDDPAAAAPASARAPAPSAFDDLGVGLGRERDVEAEVAPDAGPKPARIRRRATEEQDAARGRTAPRGRDRTGERPAAPGPESRRPRETGPVAKPVRRRDNTRAAADAADGESVGGRVNARDPERVRGDEGSAVPPTAGAGSPRIRAHYLERDVDADWDPEWTDTSRPKRDDVRGPGMSVSDFVDEVRLFVIGVFDTVERALSGLESLPSDWMGRHAQHVLRYGLGLVLVWFGTLKLASDAFPSAEMVLATADQLRLPSGAARYGLGVVEILIGIALLADLRRRALVWMLMAHLVITALPLIVVSELTWVAAPYNPTTAGESVLKNLLLIGAAMAIGAAGNETEAGDDFADLGLDADLDPDLDIDLDAGLGTDLDGLPGPEPERAATR